MIISIHVAVSGLCASFKYIYTYIPALHDIYRAIYHSYLYNELVIVGVGGKCAHTVTASSWYIYCATEKRNREPKCHCIVPNPTVQAAAELKLTQNS